MTIFVVRDQDGTRHRLAVGHFANNDELAWALPRLIATFGEKNVTVYPVIGGGQ
jgi:hypothetical protein